MADLIEKSPILSKLTMCINQSESDWDDGYNTGIAEAMQYVKNAPAVNRWIPVEDALPEKDKLYITYAETTKYCNHNEIPEEFRINILYFNGEEWYDEECRYYNVTHYMPLPELPKEDET